MSKFVCCSAGVDGHLRKNLVKDGANPLELVGRAARLLAAARAASVLRYVAHPLARSTARCQPA
jgi:hypothetical protein